MNFSPESVNAVVAWSRRFTGDHKFANTLVEWILGMAGCDEVGARFQFILPKLIETYKVPIRNDCCGYNNNGVSPNFFFDDIICNIQVRLPHHYRLPGAPALPARPLTEKVTVKARIKSGVGYYNYCDVIVFETTLALWNDSAKKEAFWKALLALWNNHRCVCEEIILKEGDMCEDCIDHVQRTPCVFCAGFVGRMEHKKVSNKEQRRLKRAFEGKVHYHMNCKRVRLN
jgi:hypothetical protein